MTDIAIVGLDCRFPGADDPDAFWDLMLRGGDGIAEIPEGRWPVDETYAAAGGPERTNTRSGGFLRDADAFDAGFFGFTPAEAEATDPQVRLLLQTTWRALENAGLDPRAQAGTDTGVYVGVMSSEWLYVSLTQFERITAHVASGMGYSMTANRISHAFDLRGPSLAVDTFCSSSLVAAQLACTALRGGDVDQALVGGVNVIVTPSQHILLTQAGLTAPDGRCKPFSRDADGLGRSEGVGVLVLRRLEDAVADGLPVYGVVKGAAVNHGGHGTVVTSPNAAAQQRLLERAYAQAGVAPADVTFVEAHATGTPVGDRVEARALGRVHGVERERPCAIGSVKGNIAHSEGAAGIAGLVKTALALDRGVVPPSRYAADVQAHLRLERHGLRLLDEPWPLPEGRVVAGVSSFGLGGTNAHVVLERVPRPEPSPPARPHHGVLTVSANDAAGLRTAAENLAADAAARPDRLAQVAWTSNRVKASGPHRLAVPVTEPDETVARLRAAAAASGEEAGADERPAVGWLLDGDGTGAEEADRRLAARFPGYRAARAAADSAAAGIDGGPADPALFAVQYAVGRFLLDLGAEPVWLAAAGAGEAAATALARTLDDAVPVVTAARIGDAYEKASTETAADRVVDLGAGATGRSGARVDGDLLELLACLYRAGANPSWDLLYDDDQRVVHRLTPYAFSTAARFWMHGTVSGHRVGTAPAPAEA